MKKYLILTSIFILLVTGSLFGYLYWHGHKTSSKTNTQKTTATTQTTTATDQTNKTSTKQSDPSEGGKYLVIKEWGVRFLLPEELRSQIATYSINEAKNIDLSTKKISTIPGCENSYVLTLDRATIDEPLGISDLPVREYMRNVTDGSIVHVGDYYYTTVTAQSNSCVNSRPADIDCFQSSPNYPTCLNLGTKEDQSTFNNALTLYQNAYKTLEQISVN